jgi:ATPase subunit of ABC transporter with duplicated ATPase domains
VRAQEDSELPLQLLSGGNLPGFLVQLKDVSFAYPGGPTLFAGADVSVTSSSRLVLLGENGNGKTTLLKVVRSLNRSAPAHAHAPRVLLPMLMRSARLLASFRVHALIC